MEFPEEYIRVLEQIAAENKMTMEQFARNIIATHLRKNYRNLLTHN